jgi:hypothetical protein
VLHRSNRAVSHRQDGRGDPGPRYQRLAISVPAVDHTGTRTPGASGRPDRFRDGIAL